MIWAPTDAFIIIYKITPICKSTSLLKNTPIHSSALSASKIVSADWQTGIYHLSTWNVFPGGNIKYHSLLVYKQIKLKC